MGGIAACQLLVGVSGQPSQRELLLSNSGITFQEFGVPFAKNLRNQGYITDVLLRLFRYLG